MLKMFLRSCNKKASTLRSQTRKLETVSFLYFIKRGFLKLQEFEKKGNPTV